MNGRSLPHVSVVPLSLSGIRPRSTILPSRHTKGGTRRARGCARSPQPSPGGSAPRDSVPLPPSDPRSLIAQRAGCAPRDPASSVPLTNAIRRPSVPASVVGGGDTPSADESELPLATPRVRNHGRDVAVERLTAQVVVQGRRWCASSRNSISRCRASKYGSRLAVLVCARSNDAHCGC